MSSSGTPLDPSDTTRATWWVEVLLSEHEGMTRAVAHLHTGKGSTLSGTGLARLNPADPDVPEIGDELAVARALAQLSHRMLATAAHDIADSTHERVTLHDMG
jgi:hypothetical protein